MPPVYRIYPMVFNTSLWRDTMRSIGENDTAAFAAVIGVAPNTLSSWRNLSDDADFPHPSMHNFIEACNALDLNPQNFFILDDTEQ